jgi:hypothetical protein
MTDPAFATRADLESWVRDMAGTAGCAAALARMSGDHKHAQSIYASAMDQVRRVALAHLHLPHTERKEAQTA